MFITNPDKIQQKYRCGKRLGEYLADKYNIPILWTNGDEYIFSNTEHLRETLKNLPFWVKVFYS